VPSALASPDHIALGLDVTIPDPPALADPLATKPPNAVDIAVPSILPLDSLTRTKLAVTEASENNDPDALA